MTSDDALAAGIAVLVRARLERHWPETAPHTDRIANTLVKRVRNGESEISLVQYVGTELVNLHAFSRGMPEAIVQDAMKFIADKAENQEATGPRPNRSSGSRSA